jgi:serine/threonine protein phosphatase PrpC
MHYAYLEMEQLDLSSTPPVSLYSRKIDPVEILQRSYEKSTQDAKHEGIVGSSTACVVVLGNDELKIANLGDCGLSIIRHNNFVFRTEEQQHSFNFPYQLGTGSIDSPQDAQVHMFYYYYYFAYEHFQGQKNIT